MKLINNNLARLHEVLRIGAYFKTGNKINIKQILNQKQN